MDKKKILLVDDVELFLELEKSFFDQERFEVLIARNGRLAIELAQKEIPDLILMDFYMPEINGDDACRQLKDNPKTSSIPIIMVTQVGRTEDLELCREAGCDDILLKPVNRQDFIRKSLRYLKLNEVPMSRIEARLEVFLNTEESRKLKNYSVNFSPGGLFLETDELEDVDTQLSLEFKLPETGAQMKCKARVAWVNHPEKLQNPRLPAGFGLQFVDLTQQARSVIRDFIRTVS
ncbi:MAG TPA: TIGR02266 family protein [Geopsychrobacteraceae bacterium]|nr:TIGR02266 family protein [Geopsychrobacteraceae bacterium]